MNVSHEGARYRYFHERVKAEQHAGDPVQRDVSDDARERLMREVIGMSSYKDARGQRQWTTYEIRTLAERVLGGDFTDLELRASNLETDEFLTLLEICVHTTWNRRKSPADIYKLQSVLADDLSAFRIRNVGDERNVHFQMQPIDNEHLHAEIVDRTFELTREATFSSAQHDYREAWKHYAKGDLDDAVVNAHKAVESAMKIVVKRVDPTKTPENMQTNHLVPLLVQLDVIPSRLQNVVVGLNQIFMNSGSLRNSAGTGHGSVDLSSPEATVALMALRMSGSLVCFLVDRYEQMKPKPAKKPKVTKAKTKPKSSKAQAASS
jgi:hypothetical protein